MTGKGESRMKIIKMKEKDEQKRRYYQENLK